jgi:uncharacterized protein YggE
MKNWMMIVVIAAVFSMVVFPNVDWGTLSVRPAQTITVSGIAQMDKTNEVAQFYAGVTATNTDKQAAITEVNTKMDEVVTKLKEFGIAAADIQTQSLSVYQDQEQITEGGRQRYSPGQWRANNSVQIKLRDGSKSSDLMSLLGGSGLTDISGPNFMLDTQDSQAIQDELLEKAVANAQIKAEKVAKANGRKVTKILNITEGSTPAFGGPMMDRAMSAAPIEPGTSTVQANATVTFEMR